MKTTKQIIKQICHYQRSIERNQNNVKRLLNCIKKLDYLPINIEILKETGIGKTVNSIRKFGDNFDLTVNALVLKWDEVLSADVNLEKSNFDGVENVDHQDENEHNNFLSSGKQEATHKRYNNDSIKSSKEIENQCIEQMEPESIIENDKKDRKLKKKSRKHRKSKKRKRSGSKHKDDNGETNKRQRIDHVEDKFEEILDLRAIDSKDGESNVVGFATAKETKPSITSTTTSNGDDDFEKDDSNDLKLDLLTSSAKLEPLNFNIVADLSATNLTNYNPRPCKQPVMNYRFSSDNLSFDESKVFLDGISSKRTHTKVYCGVKSRKLIQPASLFDNCKGVLQKYIGGLKYTSNVPFSILKPILERATPEQLLKLEDYNPYLLEDSDLLWHLHVKRYHCTKRHQEMETWREMFLRCQEEKTNYLSKLTEKFNQKKLTETPVRKIRLAYDDSKSKPPGIIRQFIEHNDAKAKSPDPIAGDAHLPAVESLKTTDNYFSDLLSKPPGRTRQRVQHNGDRAKLIATPASAVAAVGSDTINETKTRLPTVDTLKKSKEVRSAAKRPKKAPLMEKTLKYIRSLKKP